jgi:hypothetical protein
LDEAQAQPHYNSDFDAAFSLSSCLGFASSLPGNEASRGQFYGIKLLSHPTSPIQIDGKCQRALQIPQLANSKAAA